MKLAFRSILVLVLLGLLFVTHSPAQEPATSKIRLDGFSPAGYRASVTDRWSTLWFRIVNNDATPRLIRAVAFYEGANDTQFARDVWVPGNAALSAWLPIGPAPTQKAALAREIQMLLYDRTDGKDRLVLPPGEERVRGRVVSYRKHEPTMAVFVDDPISQDFSSFRVPTSDEEVIKLAKVVRGMSRMSVSIYVTSTEELPSSIEALDGLDQIILASNRLKTDPVTLAAIRSWVERGGLLWVMLDRVDPDMLGPILGESFVPTVVDRTSLTSIKLTDRFTISEKLAAREFDRPVPFVRIAMADRDSVVHSIDGWPASAVVRRGRGKILLTTLGPAGWYRDRNLTPTQRPPEIATPGTPGAPTGASIDPPSPFPSVPDLPVGINELEAIAGEFKPSEHPFTPDDMRSLLTDEIGYSVPPRGLVVGIFGAFIASLFGVGFLMRRSKQTAMVALIGPLIAFVAAGAFVAFGISARQSVPPTVATAEIVEIAPGGQEASIRGLFATYQPESGPVKLSANSGTILDLDMQGLEGQTRRRVWTDRDAWHDENLSLPAGVRLGSFRGTRTTGTVVAKATFGPDGIRGQFLPGVFQNPSDAIFVTPNRNRSAVRMAADGKWETGGQDLLSGDRYVAGLVLSDRQQRRQDVLRKLLASASPESIAGRDTMLVWASTSDVPIAVGEVAKNVGNSLVLVPIEYERTAPSTRVSIPVAFLPYRRFDQGTLRTLTMDSTYPVDSRLRFQLPPSVLPLTIERAVLHVKARCPYRAVTLNGYTGDVPTKLLRVEGPSETISQEIVDPKYLQLDATGGLHVGLVIGKDESDTPRSDTPWAIESIGLEIVGSTNPR